jgi:hypothetical protein
MSYEIEKDWTTEAGFRAVVIMGDLGHRCGYVGIPAGHLLYGVGYSDKSPHLKLDPSRSTEKMSPIQILCGAGKDMSELNSPEYVFEVHGGLTFAGNGRGKYPVESELWWFGYDCGHAGDAPAPGSKMAEYRSGWEEVHRTLEYCVEECESLAKQLVMPKEEQHAPETVMSEYIAGFDAGYDFVLREIERWQGEVGQDLHVLLEHLRMESTKGRETT